MLLDFSTIHGGAPCELVCGDLAVESMDISGSKSGLCAMVQQAQIIVVLRSAHAVISCRRARRRLLARWLLDGPLGG